MKNAPKTPLTTSRQGVADLFGRTLSWFEKIQSELEDKHNFPKRLPGMARWSVPAIERWIATNGESYLPSEANDDLQTERAQLETKYGGAA